MRIGILSDTHDQRHRTLMAVQLLQKAGADCLMHCGDITQADMISICDLLPCYIVFGNNDRLTAPAIEAAVLESPHAVCLGWGGEVQLDNKRIGLIHGHHLTEVKQLLSTNPDYLFSGHTHIAADWREGTTRRINPGALHRAKKFTVGLLDLATDDFRFLEVPR